MLRFLKAMRKYVSKWAYLACAIDTEGTITIHKILYKQRLKPTFSPVIMIVNTDLKWLQFLVKDFQLSGSIYTRKKTRKHKIVYCLTLSKLQQIIPKIRPYIKIKREQLKLIQSLLTINNEIMFGSGACPELFRKQTALYEQCKKLNKRGTDDEV